MKASWMMKGTSEVCRTIITNILQIDLLPFLSSVVGRMKVCTLASGMTTSF